LIGIKIQHTKYRTGSGEDIVILAMNNPQKISIKGDNTLIIG
jgi:hypothetical protein